jgi:hypothetical protein
MKSSWRKWLNNEGKKPKTECIVNLNENDKMKLLRDWITK